MEKEKTRAFTVLLDETDYGSLNAVYMHYCEQNDGRLITRSEAIRLLLREKYLSINGLR